MVCGNALTYIPEPLNLVKLTIKSNLHTAPLWRPAKWGFSATGSSWSATILDSSGRGSLRSCGAYRSFHLGVFFSPDWSSLRPRQTSVSHHNFPHCQV
jgi:hypothetical protein